MGSMCKKEGTKLYFLSYFLALFGFNFLGKCLQIIINDFQILKVTIIRKVMKFQYVLIQASMEDLVFFVRTPHTHQKATLNVGLD